MSDQYEGYNNLPPEEKKKIDDMIDKLAASAYMEEYQSRSARKYILNEIFDETEKQLDKWGEQNHPSVITKRPIQVGEKLDLPNWYQIPSEAFAKLQCDGRFQYGIGTWGDITIEELAEVIEAKDDEARRTELVQLAAVCVSWIHCLDRRSNKEYDHE